LGHALAARHFGVQVKRITEWMLGGVTEFAGEPATARQQLVVSAAGPLTSLAVGVVAGAAADLARVLDAPHLFVAGLLWLAGTNALLGVSNLLPGVPLDGGRVLQALLWMRWGDRARSEVAAARAGRVLHRADWEAWKPPWSPAWQASAFPQPMPYLRWSSSASPLSGCRYRSDGCPTRACNGPARCEPLVEPDGHVVTGVRWEG
jgi:Peptidase family M50